MKWRKKTILLTYLFVSRWMSSLNLIYIFGCCLYTLHKMMPNILDNDGRFNTLRVVRKFSSFFSGSEWKSVKKQVQAQQMLIRFDISFKVQCFRMQNFMNATKNEQRKCQLNRFTTQTVYSLKIRQSRDERNRK